MLHQVLSLVSQSCLFLSLLFSPTLSLLISFRLALITLIRSVLFVQSSNKTIQTDVLFGLGTEVGYWIRFEDCTSMESMFKYMTDGILMPEYLTNNDLQRYSTLMLDEAHEQTIHNHVLIG